MPPKTVVIVGGSIAGLLQGLQLKRNGSDVIVLEQDPSKNRHSHESGVQIGPSVVSLLERYDATGRPAAIPAEFLSVNWRKHLRVLNHPAPRHMSNWGCLFNLLRANFDGMPSQAVPEPPAPKDTDGKVEYRVGKRVTGFNYDQEKSRVHVQFVDVTSGEQSTVNADMLIGADGVGSTIRTLLKAPTRRNYSGYIGWRGTIPERLVSPETVEYFSNRLDFTLLRGTYLICYLIPTENGDIEPGKRLLNFVWYYPMREGSAEMNNIFTDIHGKLHANTVPQGLVKPEVWSAQTARYLPHMIAPLADVIGKIPKPFVTKVGESQCSQSSFCDGRVLLVGDAFTAFRSHLGMASEQAARHCLQMDKVWRGEATQAERDQEATLYAKKFVLLNRLVGQTGLEWVFSVIRTVSALVWLMISARLGRV